MFRVTIRVIETNEDDPLPLTFSLGIPTDCLIVSDSSSPNHRLAAAQGWAKAVGLARQAILVELGGPQIVIDACTSVPRLLASDELTPAPSFLWGNCDHETTHWILGNRVDAWLISVTHIPSLSSQKELDVA